MKKMDVRVKKTYTMLSDALLRLLKERSFADLTVLEICDEANVHRATFYKHFVDKYDFLDSCFRAKIAELSFGKAEVIRSPEGLKRHINRMISNVLLFVDRNKELFFSVSSDKYASSFNDILSNAVANYIEERLYARAELKEISSQIPLISNYYAGAIVGLIKWWGKEENPCTIQEFLSFIQPKIQEFCDYIISYGGYMDGPSAS